MAKPTRISPELFDQIAGHLDKNPDAVRRRVVAIERLMELWEARNLGMSKWQMTRMAGNVGADWALGLIPIVGAVPDFFFRSNTRNLRIIRKHLDRHHPATVTVER